MIGKMNTYNLSKTNAVSDEGSNGWLPKWRLKINEKYIWVKGPGYIVDWCGESYAEVISSSIAKDIGVRHFVEYRPCLINMDGVLVFGCESDEFYNPARYSFVTFNNLMNQGLFKKQGAYYSFEGYEQFIKDCRDIAGLNMRKHMEDMLVLDSIIHNTDRTFRNFGLLANVETGETKIADIFDNGSSLGLVNLGSKMEFVDEFKYTNGITVKPFSIYYEDHLKMVRDTSIYKRELINTKETLGFIFENFVDKNTFGVANPISKEAFQYVNGMIECGISRL